jgi:hypothetical protein
MRPQALEITADGVLSFSIRDDTNRPWWWYLDMHGEPLYLIGNACGVKADLLLTQIADGF